MARWASVLGVLLAATACGGSEESAKYAGAGVTLAAGVVGAGIYRATTGGCWGQCLDGTVCDRESGRCVHVEEREDPRAPHLVRVDCQAEEPTCGGSASAATADVTVEATLGHELAELLVRAPAIELRGHADPGCAALAGDSKSKTLQDLLREEQLADKRGRCTPAEAVSRCSLTLRRSGSAHDGRKLEFVFEVQNKSGIKTLNVATLSCSLAARAAGPTLTE